jgi:hypothetical protein
MHSVSCDFDSFPNDSYNKTVLVNSHSPTPYHNRSIWLTYWIQPDVIHLISVFFNKNLSATYEWYHWFIRISYNWLPGRSGLDRMIVAFTTTCTINAYHHWSCVLQSRARPGIIDTTLCYKVCQRLAAGLWFSPGTQFSSTNKADRHDIAELLLKVALHPMTLPPNWLP